MARNLKRAISRDPRRHKFYLRNRFRPAKSGETLQKEEEEERCIVSSREGLKAGEW